VQRPLKNVSFIDLGKECRGLSKRSFLWVSKDNVKALSSKASLSQVSQHNVCTNTFLESSGYRTRPLKISGYQPRRTQIGENLKQLSPKFRVQIKQKSVYGVDNPHPRRFLGLRDETFDRNVFERPLRCHAFVEDIVEDYRYTVFRVTYLKRDLYTCCISQKRPIYSLHISKETYILVTYLKRDLYTRCISQKRPIYSLHISKGIYELVTSQKRHMYALQLSKETYKLVKYLKTDL